MTTAPLSRPMRRVAGALLLDLLDARVRMQRGAVRLSGTVVVGVRQSGQTRWWVCELGREPQTRFVDELPAQFDAGVVVDVQSASWIMGVASEAGPLHLVTGDRELLDAFTSTYLKHTDMLALRLAVSR